MIDVSQAWRKPLAAHSPRCRRSQVSHHCGTPSQDQKKKDEAAFGPPPTQPAAGGQAPAVNDAFGGVRWEGEEHSARLHGVTVGHIGSSDTPNPSSLFMH
jgi:hypothetical protein